MKKKLALLLCGQLRSFDSTYVRKSWKKFSEKYDVDIYGCFWKNRGRSIYSVESNLPDNIDYDEIVDISEIKSIFGTENITTHDYVDWLKSDLIKIKVEKWGYNRKYFDPLFAGAYLREEVFKLFEKSNKKNYDSIVSARPDLVFLSEPPEYFFDGSDVIWHQRHTFKEIIYSTFFSSNFENMKIISKLYSSDKFEDSINYGSNRYGNVLEHCGVLYSYAKIMNIKEETYKGSLFAEPFRSELDLTNMRDWSKPQFNTALVIEDKNWFPFLKNEDE